MAVMNSDNGATPAGPDAFLYAQAGSLEGEAFELYRGQVASIGRSPTNRVVIADEVCSRSHCEVFDRSGRWILRDLGSRNGTRLQGMLIDGDSELRSGSIIQLGTNVFEFRLPKDVENLNDTTLSPRDTLDEPDTGLLAGPEILHRAREHRYGFPNTETPPTDRTNLELARLYRLALDMGGANDVKQLSQIVLEGLFSVTSADIGAILLGDVDRLPNPSRLVIVAYKSLKEVPYQRVSDSLSRIVLADREGVLARDVSLDRRLANRDSLGELSAQSVICVPVCSNGHDRVHGVLHLYATNSDNPLEKEDLEFALALADQFAVALVNLESREQLKAGLVQAESENETLREQLDQQFRLVGESPAMVRLREMIQRISGTDATVLIRGESGVGKELVARALHNGSSRRDGPFVTMNCAALSETLLESELFGHEKGSFTGATARKIGKFEQAHRGTIFLDEVGEMSAAIQSKFLRVLEGHPYERVGGGTPVKVDVRVLAATNRDLETSVEAGEFRKDLYFRLQVVELDVEPLRSRQDDIPLLAHHFLQRFARKSGRPPKALAPSALATLKAYHWPGNIRELQNTIERAVILSPEEVIGPQDIQLSALGASAPPVPVATSSEEFQVESLEDLEQRHILATLEHTGWNKSQAAQLLGIERSTLDRKLKRYDVERPRR
jgi:Nif-specific regulatory protein